MPSHVHCVSMKLAVYSGDPAVITEFEKRFNRKTEAGWSGMHFEPKGDESQWKRHLAVTMNKDLWEGIRGPIVKYRDVDDPSMGTTFSEGGWVEGPGGLHESVVPVQVNSGGSDRPWTFKVDGNDVVMYVVARFRTWPVRTQ